jgi:hypothetical protein
LAFEDLPTGSSGSIAVTGVVLQIGVLALDDLGVWGLGWELEGNCKAARYYAPVMFIIGTIFMWAGMWGCAFLIGQTTHEVCFRRLDDKKSPLHPQLLWFQPGPQVIGGQNFDPFAYLEHENIPVEA